jgi:hypothetical protein
MKNLNKFINKRQKIVSNKINKLYSLYSAGKVNPVFEVSHYLEYFLNLNTDICVKSMFIRAKSNFADQVNFILLLNKEIKALDHELNIISGE